MQTFELGKFLNGSLTEYKDHAHQKNIELTIVTDFAVDITLVGNKQKIKSLLGSVLKSTIDHSGATSIVFSVRQLLRWGREILLEFSLEDNGCILKSSKKTAYLRSLVVNRILIEDLNGKVELIVSPENGGMLKFVISCALEETENDSGDYNLSPLTGKKILVVDDNEVNQNTISQFLEKEGFEYTSVSNGIKAIELLEQNLFYDLILLDILMPQMDGFETAAYIRKKLKMDIPIIAMPARDKLWIAQMCKEAGIDQTLNKPFAVDHLLKLINSTLATGVHSVQPALMKTA